LDFQHGFLLDMTFSCNKVSYEECNPAASGKSLKNGMFIDLKFATLANSRIFRERRRRAGRE